MCDSTSAYIHSSCLGACFAFLLCIPLLAGINFFAHGIKTIVRRQGCALSGRSILREILVYIWEKEPAQQIIFLMQD